MTGLGGGDRKKHKQIQDHTKLVHCFLFFLFLSFWRIRSEWTCIRLKQNVSNGQYLYIDVYLMNIKSYLYKKLI